MDPLTIASVVQGGVGLVQSLIGNSQVKKAQANMTSLQNQRVAYSTPEEVFEARDMAINLAQTGFSSSTMDFYENQINKNLSASIGAITRMGGDANSIADTFDRSLSAVMKVGVENEAVQLQKFNNVYTQLNNVATNLSAEWQSKDNLIKDRMQAEAQKISAGGINLQSGLNSFMSAVGNYGIGQLYKKNNQDGAQPAMGGGSFPNFRPPTTVEPPSLIN